MNIVLFAHDFSAGGEKTTRDCGGDFLHDNAEENNMLLSRWWISDIIMMHQLKRLQLALMMMASIARLKAMLRRKKISLTWRLARLDFVSMTVQC